MLEGQDLEWREVVNKREVQYSNLSPGNYRFRVTASNNSGVWNEAGDVLDFSIAPAYYQTRLVSRRCVVAGVCAVLWAGYHARVSQVARSVRTTARRTSSTSAHVSRGSCTTRCFRASTVCCCDSRQRRTCCRIARQRRKSNLDAAIEHAARAITEGRDAVQGLRSSTIEKNNLALAIRDAGSRTRGRRRAPPADRHSSVAVEGETRELHPILRDEIYKIAAEALRNAFRHAHAGRVEVEIRYDDEQFRIARARRWQGDRCGGARESGSRGTLRPARHARTCCPDRREAGGVERSRRWDGGGVAPSCPHRLRDIPEAVLVVTAVGLQDAGTRRRGRVMTGHARCARSDGYHVVIGQSRCRAWMSRTWCCA